MDPAAPTPPAPAAQASVLTPGPGSPPPPAAPAPYSWPAVKEWAVRTWTQFDAINGLLWSAAFSYYAFFALFPMLVFLVTGATHFTSRERAFDFIVLKVGDYLPLSESDAETIRKTVDGVINNRGSIGLVSLAGLLWSALGFFQALVGAVNAAWAQEQPSWWRLPLKNLTMLGVLLSALLLGNFLPVISKTVQGYLTFTGWVGPALLTLANLLIPTVVLFYGFLFFYKLAPRRRANVTFKQVWLPALFVAALLQAAQQVFVIYATNFAKFNAVYGTFGGVIALMLWIYLSGIVIVFGACLAATRGQGEKEGKTAPADADSRPAS